MILSNGRLIYETIYWGVVGAILYFNRQLYTDLQNIFNPMFEAYAPVAMFLVGIALFFLINYLREAIATTYVAASQRLSGNQPLNFEKGNMNGNIQRTARRLEKKGDFQAAGEAFESLEMWRDAAMVYERGNVFGRAAMAWKNADNVGKAIEFYEKDGDFEAAGTLCESEGLQDRASRNFRIAGDINLENNQIVKSAEFYERALDFNKAGSIFEQGHKPDKALGCYEKCGNTDKILEITRKMDTAEYLRRGEEFSQLIQRCAEALVKAGHTEDAAKVFEGCQAYTRAAEVFASNELWEQSAELYLKSGQFDVAEQVAGRIEDRSIAADILARIAMKKSDWDLAGSLFEEAGKNGQAIDAYKKARNFEGAANLYESMGRYIMAGEMYSSSRKFTEAANAFAKAYDWRNAAECFEESGDLAQAIEAYANAGNYLKAGTIALKMTDYARAVEYLQRIPPGAPDFQKGTAFLATSFYYQCHYDMAYELFCRVMNDLPINKETLPAYYAYASYLEKNDPKQSLTLFRQILGIDVHYSDAADHVHKLEKIVTSMSTGYGGTPNPEPPNRSAPSSIMQARPFQQAANKSGRSSLAIQSKQQDAHQPTFNPAENVTPATGAAQIVLDHYKILSDLGNYGRVTDHIGLDTESGQQVFIRNFPIPEDLNVFDATIDLLKSASRLSHVHINPLTTFGKSDGMIYTVSPSINGQNLRTLIRSRGPLSVDDARQMFTQILEALDYAHSQDVCHLNLRPEAIIKKSTDEEGLILTGFGVPVRQPQYTESLHQTIPDFDPQYLAPEQIIGSDIDCRTDIYAIGLLLFYALTGRTPFEAKRVADTQEIARMQVQTSLPKPSNIRATLPAIVDEVFLKCVNKAPLSRYQSVSEVLGDLRQFHTTSFS